MNTRVHVHGASGRMGSAVCVALEAAPDLTLCGRSGRGDDLPGALEASRPDVLVEFTVASAATAHIAAALDVDVSVVSGTTGLEGHDLERFDARARERGIGVLVAPNFAVGVLLMQRFAADAVRFLPDVEIVEMHHERKLDAPSGTARATAQRIAAAATVRLNAVRPESARGSGRARGEVVDEIPIHSVRLPGLLAHQEVLFGAPGELLTIRHDATDRRAFMPGILLAVREIRHRIGLFQSLEPFLFDES